MRNLALQGSAAAVLAMSCASTAQFTGDYAPTTWTTTGMDLGGASVMFADDGSMLTLTGGSGVGAQTTTATHIVVSRATWSFDYIWNHINDGSSGFDIGYYTINGTKVDISRGGDIGVPAVSGHVDVAVVAGDIIGWQILSTDGFHGPGQLIISEFQIPAPSAFAMLGIAGLAGPRRRR